MISALSCLAISCWTVDEWCSHPDKGKDDYNTGRSFESLDAAIEYVKVTTFPTYAEWIMIGEVTLDEKGEEITHYLEEFSAKNPAFTDDEEDFIDASWRRERAMEAGMMNGCEAYNDEMGYGSLEGFYPEY